MGKEEPLYLKVYANSLYTELARIVGYTGFPFRELYARLQPLIEQRGTRAVALAITEMLSFIGWRVMLSERVRKYCLFLGPPPERWDEFYRHPDGTPSPRPPGHEKLPEIPPPVRDVYLEGLALLTAQDLADKLASARKKHDDAARAALASEMLRRGIEVPPAIQEDAIREKSKRKSRKKS